MKDCVHVVALRQYLKENQIQVYSEHGESPRGWVNVACERCRTTFETLLRERDEDDED